MPDDELNYQEIAEFIRAAERQYNDRRKRRDAVAVLPIILSSLALGLIMFVLLYLDRSSPPEYWGFLSLFDGNYRPPDEQWQAKPVNISLILIIVSILLCALAFVLNKLRMRRKSDKFWLISFISGIISIITLVGFLIQFVPMRLIGKWWFW